MFEGFDFEFPDYPEKRIYELKDIIEKNVDEKYTISDKLWTYLQDRKEQQKAKWNGFWYWIIDPENDEYTRTLSARYFKDWAEILVKQKWKNPRRLTPRECAKIMWFPDDYKIVVSNTQAYKQFWNSVVVPAIQDVAESLVDFVNWFEFNTSLNFIEKVRIPKEDEPITIFNFKNYELWQVRN